MDEICNAVPFKKFKMIQCRSENTSENDKKLRQMRNERHLELTLLRKTVESGDIAKVKELLKQQPPLNCRVGGLMLWHAVSHNHLEIATMLVDAGADLFVRKESDDSESSFLHVLMSSNDPRHHRLAVQMMNRGADVNAADEHYLTVLQTALLAKSPAKLITEIVNHGADVNISSIMNATEYLDSRELLMLLVDKFLNVGSRSRLVERLLLRCGYTEQDETRILPIVQKLLDEKLPVAEINRNGSTLVAAVHSGKIQMVKLLIEYGFDVNTSGISPLYEILDCILPINSEPVGELPLYAASASDRPDITKLLIAAGAEINTPSSCSVFYTGYPLHAACGRRNEENIRLLLRHGADVNLMDSRFRTPFSIINYIEYPTELHRLLIKNFALLESKNKTVNKSDSKMVLNCPEMHEYYTLCMNELRRMKALKIIHKIFFFSIFTTSEKELSFTTRNKYFVQNYNSEQKQDMFPNYYDDMNFLFENAEKRRKQLHDKEEALCKSLQNYLPFIPLERVIYYLYLNDRG